MTYSCHTLFQFTKTTDKLCRLSEKHSSNKNKITCKIPLLKNMEWKQYFIHDFLCDAMLLSVKIKLIIFQNEYSAKTKNLIFYI